MIKEIFISFNFFIMKNKNISCPLCNTFHKPEWGFWMLRVAVAVLFFFPGLNKVLHPENFQGLLENIIPVSGISLLILFWGVVAFELLGGLVVLLGKILPSALYKITLLGQAIILLTALFMVTIPSGDMMGIYFHILGLASLFTLFLTRPMCPLGISGYACKEGK